MVSVPQERKLNSFLADKFTLLIVINWLLISHFMYLNLIPQSVIKQDMKIKLRMEGAVNGHKFVIEGEGIGSPWE